MKFNFIDISNWKRKEYFYHYFRDVPCTYSFTFDLNITNIINKQIKLYPFLLFSLTTIVNKHEEFRTSLDENGNLGFYSDMNPSYTIFHDDTKTFSNIYTEYSTNFNEFLKRYNDDINLYKTINSLNPKPNIPLNCFNISMIPWEEFTGFNLNLENGYKYLLPIFTFGKFRLLDGKYTIPLSIQVHHGVCDGYHVCNFIKELREFINNF